MIMEIDGIRPTIGANVFIAPTAVVIGNVSIGDGASIWYNTVIRGDTESITIGRNVNIQDNCTVHADPGIPAVIGDGVVVGHNAVLHGCRIESECLIGIGAVVLNNARIRRGSVVATGAVVTEGRDVGPFHLVAGVPAVLKKELPVAVLDRIGHGVAAYQRLSEVHRGAVLLDGGGDAT
ncbi:MAG: gamma carbonic anhydrase family protein [Desulfobacterales bacterium]